MLTFTQKAAAWDCSEVEMTPVERAYILNSQEQRVKAEQDARIEEWRMKTIVPNHNSPKTAKKNELHISLGIPKPIGIEIHNWAEEQDWPEGTELEPIEEYHITMLYSPEGHNHKDDPWMEHESHAVSVNGIKAFPSYEREDKDAIVLTVDSETIGTHHDELAQSAVDSGIEISPFSFDDFKPHMTIAYGSLPEGLKPPQLTFETLTSSVSPPREENLTDLLKGSLSYGCGQVWLNRKKKKILINIGDGEGDKIDQIRDLAEKEWPNYDVDIDAEIGFPGDDWKLDPLSAAEPTKQEERKSAWSIAHIRAPYEAELIKFAADWEDDFADKMDSVPGVKRVVHTPNHEIEFKPGDRVTKEYANPASRRELGLPGEGHIDANTGTVVGAYPPGMYRSYQGDKLDYGEGRGNGMLQSHDVPSYDVLWDLGTNTNFSEYHEPGAIGEKIPQHRLWPEGHENTYNALVSPQAPDAPPEWLGKTADSWNQEPVKRIDIGTNPDDHGGGRPLIYDPNRREVYVGGEGGYHWDMYPYLPDFDEDRWALADTANDDPNNVFPEYQNGRLLDYPKNQTEWYEPIRDENEVNKALGANGSDYQWNFQSRIADSWQPKDSPPSGLRERAFKPTDVDCTCKDGQKLSCPVHGMHPVLPTYEHTFEFPNPASPVGYDYKSDGVRTWMRAETKVSTTHSLNWTPGGEGKGIIFPGSHEVHTWNVDSDPYLEDIGEGGKPHHADYLEQIGWGNPYDEGQRAVFDAMHSFDINRFAPEHNPPLASPWHPDLAKHGFIQDPHEKEWDFESKVTFTRYKLWLDDTRHPPKDEDWDWAKDVAEAQKLIKDNDYTQMSLDHDLGIIQYEGKVVVNPDALSGGDFCLWLHEHKKHMPKSVNIHSHNSKGIKLMKDILEKHTDVTTDRAPDDLEEDWAREFKVHEPSKIEKEVVHLPKRVGLFHVAPTIERERIRAWGLLPNDPLENHDYEWDPRQYAGEAPVPTGVYGWDDPQDAKEHAEYLEQFRGIPHDIWQFSDQGSVHDPDQDNSWVVHHPVQPQLVEGPEHYAKKITGGNPVVDDWDNERWQRGACLSYAEALHSCDPTLKWGMHFGPNTDPDYPKAKYEPQHIFVHDDKYAYDSLGKHRLPYKGRPGYEEWPRTRYDVPESMAMDTDFREDGSEDEAFDHIRSMHPQYNAQAQLGKMGYNPAEAPKRVIDYLNATDTEAENDPRFNEMSRKHPKYFGKVAGEHTDWHFAKETLPQQQRRWEDLKNGDWNRPRGISDEMWMQAPQSQSHSEVVHSWPNGWTVQRHPDIRSVRAVGQMMHNCWQSANDRGEAQREGYDFQSLHDPHDIPRAAFYRYNDPHTIEPPEIKQPLGMRNHAVDPESWNYLNQYAQKHGITPPEGPAAIHVAADQFDTREYPDALMMPPTTMQEPAQGNPHPEKEGCTCEQGRKLDCPVHGLNPTEENNDHTWSIPQGHPVGYPESGPRNYYIKAEGSKVVRPSGDYDDGKPHGSAVESSAKQSAYDRGKGDQQNGIGIDHDPSIANCDCLACRERDWHIQSPGTSSQEWSGLPRAEGAMLDFRT